MKDRITLSELREAIAGRLQMRADDYVIISDCGMDVAVLAGIGLLDRLRAPETKDERPMATGLESIIADAEDLYVTLGSDH